MPVNSRHMPIPTLSPKPLRVKELDRFLGVPMAQSLERSWGRRGGMSSTRIAMLRGIHRCERATYRVYLRVPRFPQ